MLTFDEASHTYAWDGQPVPNVTGILSEVVNWSHVPPNLLETARARGTRVHAACQYDDEPIGLNESTVDPSDMPFVQAWRRFKEVAKPEWEGIEERVYHPRLRYAGTRDRSGFLRALNEYAIVDLKTGEWAPQYGLQLSAYLEADSKDITIDKRACKRYCVLLRNDGTYKLHAPKASHAQDFAVFAGLAQIWHWKKANGC